MTGRRRVAVVTGGGGGIGAAIAEELGRTGAYVVTVDPLVSVDGAEQLPPSEDTTAGRIVAAGGQARAASTSVTDRAAVTELFQGLAEEFGGLDAVINVAGISRPTGFARGTEDDWRAVLSVHLDGYLNVLGAALPLMAAAGRGHILGVTSGSGWREADAGAYSCAKRAVASITWELGRSAPPGVVVNALSPIAATRMVTAALARAPKATGPTQASVTGGLSLGGMPDPAELGPLAAHLVAEGFDACRGQVVFTAGSEVALIGRPRFLEVVRTHDVASLPDLLDHVVLGALVPSEIEGRTVGGTNARFASEFDAPADAPATSRLVRSCALAVDEPALAAALTAALEARGVACRVVDPSTVGDGFGGRAAALDAIGELDALVVAPAGRSTATATAIATTADGWGALLHDHDELVDRIHGDAAWARAMAVRAAAGGRPVRMVTLLDATGPGGRSRAQAATQLARAASNATEGRVAAFVVGLEADGGDEAVPIAELTAYLLCDGGGGPLGGAELAVGPGWLGLRSHPEPKASIVLGGPHPPGWFDDVLRDIADAEPV